MTKKEIINLYIFDLKAQVLPSPARENRIEMLEIELFELESTKPVNVDLADINGKKYLIDYKDFDGTVHHVVIKGKTEEEAKEKFKTDYPLAIVQIREIGYR